MSLMSKSTGHDDVRKLVGILKKPQAGASPNNAQWFEQMETHLSGLGFGWVIAPDNERYSRMKDLELAAQANSAPSTNQSTFQ